MDGLEFVFSGADVQPSRTRLFHRAHVEFATCRPYLSYLTEHTLPALHALGWTIKSADISVLRTTTNIEPSPSFGVLASITMERELTATVMTLSLGSLECGSPEEALAGTTVKGATLRDRDATPLEGGKGQIVQARRLAERIARANADSPEWTAVEVLLMTRAGRGGWKCKTAHRIYTKTELLPQH